MYFSTRCKQFNNGSIQKYMNNHDDSVVVCSGPEVIKLFPCSAQLSRLEEERAGCHGRQVCALCLFLVVPWVGMWSVIVASPGHTHLLLFLFFVVVVSFGISPVTYSDPHLYHTHRVACNPPPPHTHTHTILHWNSLSPTVINAQTQI